MRIEKSECNYQVTECDLKFGEEITLDGELLIPISTLDKIETEIKKLDYFNCKTLEIIDNYRNRK